MRVPLGALRSWLPKGRTLPDEVWRKRHRAVCALLWGHAAFIPVFAAVRGYDLRHIAEETAIVPFIAIFASLPALGRRSRTAIASIGLLTSSAVLVHLSGGVIEMHFHFFVMVAVVALYQDWLPFLAAIGYVLLHHGAIGALDASSVFNHYAAMNDPWKWAAVHALFIAGISVVCLANWRLNEATLSQRRAAEERLRQESRIVETLHDVGRAVAAELDLQKVVQHVTDAATQLTSAAFGAFFYNVADASGNSYMLYTLSGAPPEAFAAFDMPRATAVFEPTFVGAGPVRSGDITQDPRYGKTGPHFGMPEGHLGVRSYLAVPVQSARGAVLGGLFFGHPEPDQFDEVDERLAVGIAAHAAIAIDNATLYTAQRESRQDAEAAQRRLALLAEASEVLGSSLELEQILKTFTKTIAGSFADTCTVYLLADGAVRQVAAAGPTLPGEPNDRFEAPPAPISDVDNPVVRAVLTGKSEYISNVTDDLLDRALPDAEHRAVVDTLGLSSAIVVPLRASGDSIGALAVSTTRESSRHLTPDDQPLVEELGRRAGVAVEHVRLYAAQRSAAETLQHSLLPVLPDIPGVAVASRYLPGGPDVEVGGDWYDVLALPDGHVALAMGDVVGRGISAASLMGQLRNALRAYILDGCSPAATLDRLNHVLNGFGTAQQMATVVVMVFDPETGTLSYSNAGHPPPLVQHSGRDARFLEDGVGVPLGAIAAFEYPQAVAKLEPGSTVVLYTDGLVEERDLPLDVGLDRLHESVVNGPDDLDALCEHLTLHGPGQQRAQDDLAVLAFRWLELGARLRMTLETNPRVLRPLRATLRRWLESAGANEQETYETLVAASEACSNAIKHGTPTATHFDFTAEVNGDVTVTVRSTGTWRTRRETAPGGRGLDIIDQFMDATDVTTSDGVTVITMRRALSQSTGVLTGDGR